MKMTAIVCAVVAFCLAATAGPARAQGGAILLTSDDVSFDCDFTETVSAVNSIWVIHTLKSTAYGAQFKVDEQWTPLGTAIRLGVYYGDFLYLGDIYQGIAISYEACKALPRTLARLDFFVFSPTPTCTPGLSVVADPLSSYGTAVTLDCSLEVLPAIGGSIWVNVLPECSCVVGTEETTWSRLKALYR
jgi:hypothetical protein